MPEAESARSSYRMSISRTTHSTSAALLGTVMIGVTRCGMPSYAVSSTRFGSTSIIRTSSGVDRIKIEVIIELTKLDFPEPVAPATNRCGILARLAITTALDILAQAHSHRVMIIAGPRGAEHVTEGHNFLVEVRNLDPDGRLPGNG